jgi:hypothetical protein
LRHTSEIGTRVPSGATAHSWCCSYSSLANGTPAGDGSTGCCFSSVSEPVTMS